MRRSNVDVPYQNIINALQSTVTKTYISHDEDPINMIHRLLLAGANPNVCSDGYTILEIACICDMYDVAKLLVSNGANVNHIGSAPDSQPPIYGTLSNRTTISRGILELLLKHGTDPNSYDKTDICALFRAIRQGDIECMKILLRYKANANIQARDGNTCLHMLLLPLLAYPLRERKLAMIQLLLASGADKNIYNNHGQRPIDIIQGRISVSDFEGHLQDMYRELFALLN